MVILRDRKSLIITLCMPAVLTTILGFAFQNMMMVGNSIGRANIAVVSMGSREDDIERIKEFLDSTAMEGRIDEGQKAGLLDVLDELDFESILYEEVLDNPQVGEFVHYEKMDLEKARELMDKGELASVVVIPRGFTYNSFMNLVMPFRNPIRIEIIKHPDHSIKAEAVAGMIKGFTDALSAGIIAKNVLLEASIENNVGDMAMNEIESVVREMYHIGVKEIKLDKVTEEGKRTVSSFQYFAVGMAVMFILYVAADGAQYAIDEVHNGTYSRLIMASAGRFRFFVSRFAATTLFAIMQLIVLVNYSRLVFKTDWGSPAGVAVLSLFLAVAVGGLSVLLSSINLRLRNSKASTIFQAVVIQFSALVGGSFFPVSGIPVMQKLSRLTINGTAMQGYLKLMMGYGLEQLTGTLFTLTAITLVFFAAGVSVAAAVKER